MAYTRAIKPNYGLNVANVVAMNLGAPALASTNRFVTSVAMGNKTFTLANTTHADAGMARNVTVTGTQVGGVDDTFGTITVTGTNVLGNTITDTLTPVNGSTVAGTKAFLTVTSIVQSGWTAGGTADNLVIGTGDVIGMPYWMVRQNPPIADAAQFFLVLLGGAVVARTIVFDDNEIEKCTVNASAGTYNGSKTLQVLAYR